MRVLVVEDNPAVLATIGFQLKYGDIVHDLVAHTDDALTMLSEEHTLVITDWQMPNECRIDGFGLIRDIRAKNKTLPIILMSSHEIEPEKLDELEIQHFIHKQFDNPEVTQFAELAKKYSL